jgi:hypothetical protein
MAALKQPQGPPSTGEYTGPPPQFESGAFCSHQAALEPTSFDHECPPHKCDSLCFRITELSFPVSTASPSTTLSPSVNQSLPQIAAVRKKSFSMSATLEFLGTTTFRLRAKGLTRVAAIDAGVLHLHHQADIFTWPLQHIPRLLARKTDISTQLPQARRCEGGRRDLDQPCAF